MHLSVFSNQDALIMCIRVFFLGECYVEYNVSFLSIEHDGANSGEPGFDPAQFLSDPSAKGGEGSTPGSDLNLGSHSEHSDNPTPVASSPNALLPNGTCEMDDSGDMEFDGSNDESYADAADDEDFSHCADADEAVVSSA